MSLQPVSLAPNGHGHAARSFRDLELIHSVPGRIRIRASLLKRSAIIRDRFRNLLLIQQGIHDVTVSGRCSTATIFYDKKKWSAASLSTYISMLNEKRLKEADPPVSDGEESHPLTDSGFNVCLSSSGLAVGLLVETLLAWPALFVSALPMLERARRALFEQQRLTLDVLDTSAGGVFIAQGFLPMAQFVVWMVNLSDYLRDRTGHSSPAVTETHHPDPVRAAHNIFSIVRDGESCQIPVDEMQPGDLLTVVAGERIPVDGTVRQGSALLDREMITGQPIPQAVTVGDHVCASDRVCVGEAVIEVRHPEHGTGEVMQKLVPRRRGETRIEHYGRKWADSWVPLSFLASGTAAGVGAGLQGAAAPLIIDYGGVRLAAPTAILSAMYRAAALGILFKHGRAMERLANVDTIVFDKTKTLTTGIFERAEVHAYGCPMEELLDFAATIEQTHQHPLVSACTANHAGRLNTGDTSRPDSALGLGIERVVSGQHVTIGPLRTLSRHGINGNAKLARDAEQLGQSGLSSAYLAIEGEVRGLLGYRDRVHAEADSVLEDLRRRKIQRIILLSGDSHTVTKHTAEVLGIERYYGDMLPHDKAMVIHELKRQGHTVAMVGDGANDVPALVAADVGIAVANSTPLARAYADIELQVDGLRPLCTALALSQEAADLIRQSWHIVSMPNTIALALAACAALGPLGAAILGNGSAIAATMNGLRPFLFRPPDIYSRQPSA
ncbi:MAG TPA: HAD-IC family P-type ATPase [Nitrospiraceae bacterium]|nr:HAD-IC family P-type ATPase [Nitrospiraceae bacterium]